MKILLKGGRKAPRGEKGAAKRETVLLALIIGISLAAVLVPAVRYFHARADAFGCASALSSANEQLDIKYLTDGGFTAEEAKNAVAFAMNGWDDLCPGGGTVHLKKNEGEGTPFSVICGLHCPDAAVRTRLNAGFVLEQLKRVIVSERIQGENFPQSIIVNLNNKEYNAALTDGEAAVKRGTKATSGVSGTVIFYSLAGYGEAGKSSGLSEGEVFYFCFADEEHCAIWRSQEGWTLG